MVALRRISYRTMGFAAAFAVVIATAGVVASGNGAVAATNAVQTRLLRAGGLVIPTATLQAGTSATAPTDAQCRAVAGMACYSPQEMQHAYGVDHLLAQGDDGAGETIVIVESFGSPTLSSDLGNFDTGYGLPAPPSLTVLSPLGTVPFDPTNKDQVSWATETTLDVEWAHAMAPAAGIVVLTSPVDETEGVQGMPEFDSLLNYALDHHLGQVISQSWAATENTLFTPQGEAVIKSFETTYTRAAASGVTVLAASGDTGSTSYELDGSTLYSTPVVNFPASSPLVTAVGGTSLSADTSGNYQSETVWNNGYGASGGGLSQVFGEPLYQRFLPAATEAALHGARALPDVSWNADLEILIYLSFLGPANTGYYFVGGTSAGPPQWAGLVGDLDQLSGRPVGLLNPYLYAFGALGGSVFHDIAVGNNAFKGVAGYSASPGWDLASGWGTPNVGTLLTEIASLVRQGP